MTEDHPMAHRWKEWGIYCVGCPERSKNNPIPEACARCMVAHSRSPLGQMPVTVKE